MSDDKDDLADRLGERFDEGNERDDATNETAATGSTTETSEAAEVNEANALHAANVKQAWNGKSVYLPDFLKRKLRTTYKRADLMYEEEFDESLQKTRYYYPLVISLGIEQIANMEADEIDARIEQMADEAERR